MFDILPLPAFNDNYIWLIKDAATRQAVVVDPGDAAPVLAWLDANPAWRLTDILITHHHNDHTGGITALKQRSGARVSAPADERIAAVDLPLADGQRLEVLGVPFEVLRVPGHTAGHIAFHAAGERPLLFSGDTLFSAGCGRLFEGTPSQMLTSLQRLARLPDATEIYCGHEYTLSNLRFAQAVEPENPAVQQALAETQQLREAQRPTLPSTLGRERRINPFLRTAENSVRLRLQEERGVAADAPEDTYFAALRGWKDTF
ncbi:MULTISPECIES: hydroxyacylglutathione hydrolase [unclassified Pseudomonas]|uniref:hydroxyacylglutathione hydrolase n=1 Tax=unclassified Pseudomonas TaxID=196821 RepID=UPI0023621729|nr:MULTISPECIES: hydroxyacylglutathione hydrolase [unclassified Pseudomonas]MDR6178333.1 hydroxyacylglutathione hydrolase [Pseudomonas sp. SORGH_AS_0211]